MSSQKERSQNETSFEVSAEKVISLPSPCDDSVLVVLHPGERLYFHGKVKISVKKGNISVVGHIIRGGSQESSKKRKKPQIQSTIYYSLYSPFTSSALFIEHSDINATRHPETPELEGQTELETTERQQIIEEVLSAFDFPAEVSVAVFRRFGNNSTDVTNHLFTPPSSFLSNQQPQQKNTKTKDDANKIDNFGIPEFYPLLRNNNSWTGLCIPSLWTDSFKVVNSSHMTPVVLVCGAKNSGKSTYSRCLANNMLNNFPNLAWLETDLGQPEFAAPGMVALSTLDVPLFGTPLTHTTIPERAYFVGGNAPTDPEFYLKCIVDLYRDFYASNAQPTEEDPNQQSLTTPLVINTHGWVKGLGKDILFQLIRTIQPTHIVQVVSTDEPDKLSLSSVLSDYYQPVILDVPSKANSNPSMPLGAPERRLQQLLSYFTKGRVHTTGGNLLDCMKLYEVPWFGETGNIRVCTSKHSGVAYSELLMALNGQLVGLANDETIYKFKHNEEQQFITNNQLPMMISNYPSCVCIGLGIVYKIDPTRKVFQILTTLSAEEVEEVNTLMLGQLDASTVFTLMTTPHGLIPYLSSHSKEDAVAGSAVIERKFIKRKFK